MCGVRGQISMWAKEVNELNEPLALFGSPKRNKLTLSGRGGHDGG